MKSKLSNGDKTENKKKESIFKRILNFKILQLFLGKEIDLFTTLGQFKKLKAVNQISLIGLCIYALLFLSLITGEIINSDPSVQIFWIKGVIEFIPSVAELTSVFIGFVLAFYWEKADSIKTKNWNRLQIYRSIKKELENNIKMIEEEKVRYKLLKITSWEIYKEKIGDFVNEPNVNLLTNIYSNIYRYDEKIKNEPLILDLGKKERDYMSELIKEINVDFKTWKENLTKAYDEIDIKF